jgi:hypothetical protein
MEGALLLSTAVVVDDSTEVAVAAVPVTAFVYQEQDYKQDTPTAEADLPMAPFLPQYQSMSM